jgi:ABC-type polysaccharide/polyol phosphate transport system ATPase subunit
MEAEKVIELINISKSFHHHKKNFLSNNPKDNRQLILNDVNLTIMKGSVTGIIGSNGSGKSTLLKIIGGILKPDTGSVFIRGKVVSILELGTGFIKDISGFENVKYYFQLLGFGNEYNEDVVKKIITFSELEDYIYEPVKNYSSGMHMRLAFSIIIHLPSDIFLLDEVFSVGDQSFRMKCLKIIGQLSQLGKTFLLVTHDLYQIRNICDKIVYIKDNEINTSNQINQVVDNYLNNTKQYDKNLKIHENICLWESPLHNPIVSKIQITSNKAFQSYDISDCLSIEIEMEKLISENIFFTVVFNYGMDLPILGVSPNYSEFNYTLEGIGIKKFNLEFPSYFFNTGIFLINLFIYDIEKNFFYKIDDIVRYQFRNRNMNDKNSIENKFSGPFFIKNVWKNIDQ